MGYNKGDSYEEKIFDILKEKNLIILDSTRGGAGNSVDIELLYQGKTLNLEVKLDLKADYGQKMLKWNNGAWSWSTDDSVTKLYTSLDVLDRIESKNLQPNRFIIPQEEITEVHKKEDQNAFEDKITISIDALYNFYANKNCYYIQIGNQGFYHLKEDKFSLGTVQFKADLKLRLRAKTIQSNPVYKYGFYAVLKIVGNPPKSNYDLEEKDGRKFPPLA